ncbi:hypothetical protein CWI38_2369p0010 [Hamiltosporidium tvaerminnensis]|uniref:Uncharacterized protein n=1 Tax=Hamiltosporidium tvaerminnensis TaxID=1176355 RepID=A0A4Q9LI53_9MICR|nr:hypothetical protein CWI37_0091p0040 [Hamiltosporidium tvaerminnensis]TBU07657.1 hypothetical protein CWI38_2369p0010 [Hamiltosporidium tvaerminnensis]
MFFSSMNQQFRESENSLPTYEQVCGDTPATTTTLDTGRANNRFTQGQSVISSGAIGINLESGLQPRNTGILAPPENSSFSDEVVSWFNLYLSKILYFSYIFVLIELINLKYLHYARISNILIIYQAILILILISYWMTKTRKKLGLFESSFIFLISTVLYAFFDLIYSIRSSHTK